MAPSVCTSRFKSQSLALLFPSPFDNSLITENSILCIFLSSRRSISSLLVSQWLGLAFALSLLLILLNQSLFFCFRTYHLQEVCSDSPLNTPYRMCLSDQLLCELEAPLEIT